MKMARLEDIHETFGYLATELKARFPEMAYLHLVEPRASGLEDAEVKEGESLDFLASIWGPKPLLIAGGLKAEDAEKTTAKYDNSVAVYGRYFIPNPDLVARIKHHVPFRPYDRSTFYKFGPQEVEGYTTYPVEYGPEGKL
jgi:NADPH2 dehydrogenase